MIRLLLLLTIFTFAVSAGAQPLKLARSVSDPASELQNLKEIGAYIVQELDGDTFDSYDVISDGKANNKAFIDLIKRERPDIIVETLYSAALYSKKTDMEPVLLMNIEDSVYVSSYIVARKTSDINSLYDLTGKALALKDTVSTAYYYLPLKVLHDKGLKTVNITAGSKQEKDSVGYLLTGSKYQVANSVFLKKADAGVISSVDWNNKSDIPPFMKESLKVIYKTDYLPGTFMLIRKDMPKNIKNKIVSILMDLSDKESAKTVFQKCKVNSFHKIEFDWKELFNTTLHNADGID